MIKKLYVKLSSILLICLLVGCSNSQNKNEIKLSNLNKNKTVDEAFCGHWEIIEKRVINLSYFLKNDYNDRIILKVIDDDLKSFLDGKDTFEMIYVRGGFFVNAWYEDSNLAGYTIKRYRYSTPRPKYSDIRMMLNIREYINNNSKVEFENSFNSRLVESNNNQNLIKIKPYPSEGVEEIKFNEKKNLIIYDEGIEFYYVSEIEEPDENFYKEIELYNNRKIDDYISYIRYIFYDKLGIKYKIDTLNNRIIIEKIKPNSLALKSKKFKRGYVLINFSENPDKIYENSLLNFKDEKLKFPKEKILELNLYDLINESF